VRINKRSAGERREVAPLAGKATADNLANQYGVHVDTRRGWRDAAVAAIAPAMVVGGGPSPRHKELEHLPISILEERASGCGGAGSPVGRSVESTDPVGQISSGGPYRISSGTPLRLATVAGQPTWARSRWRRTARDEAEQQHGLTREHCHANDRRAWHRVGAWKLQKRSLTGVQMKYLAWYLVGLVLAGCQLPRAKHDSDAIQAERETETTSSGVPKWVRQCSAGLPARTICAAGESDLAATDVEAAKTDAEISAKNRLVDQLQTKVGRLQERAVSAMKDLSGGKVLGERTLKDINQNFVEQKLIGLKYVEYFYFPNELKPKKIFVLATVDANDAQIAADVLGALQASAKAERLEVKHEEAQVRFDKVRKDYLAEEAQRDEALSR
jgi:hypothetical protein